MSYKLASVCIANRLKQRLPLMISEDQTRFTMVRFIGKTIRTVYDTMFYAEKRHIPGLLLLINFKKGFDSLAWTFSQKVLEFYNFSTLFIEWIKLFYNNMVACVTVNGHLSDWFSSHRGCRQGDPLSPFIFII